MILIGGPYVGEFKYEVLTFRPYLQWLIKYTNPESVYIHTHSNRAFLYDFIDSDNIIPVYEHISREEKGQIGYIHEDVDSKLFQSLVKDIKNNVCQLEDCTKKEIEIYNLNYVKSTPHLSIYKKKFSPIEVPDMPNPYKDKIIFIPHNSEKREILKKVRCFLRDYDDLVIAGNCRTRFRKHNVVLKMIDYYENGLKLLIKMISEAKAVICPISFWTTICNLQHVPVFSWGSNAGQHKEGGIYHFQNEKCVAFPSNDINIILRMIEGFIQEIYNGNNGK